MCPYMRRSCISWSGAGLCCLKKNDSVLQKLSSELYGKQYQNLHKFINIHVEFNLAVRS